VLVEPVEDGVILVLQGMLCVSRDRRVS
jgi:hypothetical protein